MQELLLTPTSWNADESRPATEDPLLTESESWVEITAQMATGDTVAFRRFYDAYFDVIFHEARRVTGRDEQSCLDIVQNTFLKLIRAMRRLPCKAELDAYVRVVTRCAAYDWLRTEMRVRKLHSNLAIQQNSESGLDPSSIAENEQIVWLESQLRQLDPQLRQLIHWRYRWGWTLQAIAKQLGLKTGAVDGQLRRAIHKLKATAKKEKQND